MKLITLTPILDDHDVHINVDRIHYFYEDEEKTVVNVSGKVIYVKEKGEYILRMLSADGLK